jgi:hypothetical protein
MNKVEMVITCSKHVEGYNKFMLNFFGSIMKGYCCRWDDNINLNVMEITGCELAQD